MDRIIYSINHPKEPATMSNQTNPDEYNGWTNRQTWNVALWIGNDWNLYQTAQFVAKSRTKPFTPYAAKKLCQDLFPTNRTPDKVRLEKVNWQEIAKDLNEQFFGE